MSQWSSVEVIAIPVLESRVKEAWMLATGFSDAILLSVCRQTLDPSREASRTSVTPSLTRLSCRLAVSGLVCIIIHGDSLFQIPVSSPSCDFPIEIPAQFGGRRRGMAAWIRVPVTASLVLLMPQEMKGKFTRFNEEANVAFLRRQDERRNVESRSVKRRQKGGRRWEGKSTRSAPRMRATGCMLLRVSCRRLR